MALDKFSIRLLARINEGGLVSGQGAEAILAVNVVVNAIGCSNFGQGSSCQSRFSPDAQGLWVGTGAPG